MKSNLPYPLKNTLNDSNIQEYIDSLDTSIELLYISNQPELTFMPDLSRFNLKGLQIHSNGFKKLSDLSYLVELEHLLLNHNQLTSLPPLPENMKNLRIFNNQLTELVLPSKLESLSCGFNPIKTIKELSSNLESFSCENCLLEELPDLPDTIGMLHIGHNKIKRLPKLPSQLYFFECNHCELEELPELPPKITHIYCHDNKLKSLPKLNDPLGHLCCQNNELTELPDLNDSLHTLFCGNNQLRVIPKLGHNLKNPHMNGVGELDYPRIDFKGNPLFDDFFKGLCPRLPASHSGV